MHDVGALIIRKGLGGGVYYTLTIIRNPENPILIIQAPTLFFLPSLTSTPRK